MKIAIDALNITKPGGGRSATLNLLQPLFSIDQINEYIVFLNAPEQFLQQDNVRQVIAPTHNRISSRVWAQLVFPRMLRNEQVNLIHHVKNLVTTGNPCPTLVTIHDLTILAHPEIYPTSDVLYWRTIEKHNLRRVDHILAVSQTTADDLCRCYHLPSDKITVIHEGIDDSFKPATADEIMRVRAKYHLPKHFLLHVGSISAKKNLATLVYAFSELHATNQFDGGLVLVGRSYFREGDPALNEAIAKVQNAAPIVLTGAVPQEDLPAIVTAADCFVFPSLHEGFGLVPLEAMACGVPVVATRSNAVEEVLGDAAILVDDPYDVPTFIEQIIRVLHDQKQREGMKAKGLERAALYTRRHSARLTLELYQRLRKKDLRSG